MESVEFLGMPICRDMRCKESTTEDVLSEAVGKKKKKFKLPQAQMIWFYTESIITSSITRWL